MFFLINNSKTYFKNLQSERIKGQDIAYFILSFPKNAKS
jgi:hypothetical protein